MTRLMMVIFSVAATTLMGSGIVLVLVLGMVSVKAIVAAAVIGFLLALPASWLLARAIP
jgi:preprotein translocase subunit SecF